MSTKKIMKICLGSSCFARGNKELLKIAKAFVVQHQLEDKVDFRGSHCFDKCQHGPNLTIDGHFFHHIDSQNLEEILRTNLLDH